MIVRLFPRLEFGFRQFLMYVFVIWLVGVVMGALGHKYWDGILSFLANLLGMT